MILRLVLLFLGLFTVAVLTMSARGQGQQTEMIVLEDSDTGCKFGVYGSRRGLEVATSRDDCKAYTRVDPNVFGRQASQ
jgi:hypothetical protein